MNIIKNSFFKDAQFNGFFIALTFLTTSLYAHQIPPIPNGYENLESILRNYSKHSEYRFVLQEVQPVLMENSDFIRTLQEIEIADDFLPYIADYERVKGSPIDPNIRIFFYDGSKMPADSDYRLAGGACMSLFDFIFINNRFWSSSSVNITQEMFSVLDQSIEERRQTSSGEFAITLPDHLYQNIPKEYLRTYLSYDAKGRARLQNFAIGEEKQIEARLLDEEISLRDHFLRRLKLFHELGHCDLNRTDEEKADSIMNYRVMHDIEERISSEYPYIALENLLNNSLINELFLKRDTYFEQPSLFDSWLAKLGFGPASDENKTRATQNVQKHVEDIEAFIMTTNLYDL